MAIVISARVHPGESTSSYVMEGIIDFLTGYSEEAKFLRDNFVFKIIPMLNIDGVVNGNYRSNLVGVDLNRQWMIPSKKEHPTIYHAKAMIKKLKEDRDVLVYVDIHNHSKKKNIFFYGCNSSNAKRIEHVLPLLMEKNCCVFSYKDCSFALQKCKESTARMVNWKEFKIDHCFTLEMSFCSADYGIYEYIHFNLQLFYEIAFNLIQSIYDMVTEN